MMTDWICGEKIKQDNYNDKMMMVEYARKYVPYYTKLYECLPENIVDVCFEKIPTVDKKMLLKGEVCLSLKFIGEYIRDELIHVYTSGSTGCHQRYIGIQKK